MEDRDLKSAVRQIKEKKKRETLERLIIFLSGLLITLAFIAVGLNYYSRSDKTVSEPQVKIVSETNKPPTPPPPQQLQTTPPVKEIQTSQQNQPQPEKQINQNTNQSNQPHEEKIKEPTPKKEEPTVKQKENQEITKKEVEKQEPKRKEVVKKEQTKHESKKEDTSVKEIVEKIKSGYFSIQVGAFSTREKAETEKAKYPNAHIIEEGGLHKVLVGKFDTEKQAREYQKQHEIKGFIKRVGL